MNLPSQALDAHLAIIGKTGGGKSYTAKGLVERLLDEGRRVCVLDPVGVWWGLRSNAAGDGPAYPVAIFGGDHADIALSETAGQPLAKVIAGNNLPAIIDTSDFGVGERVRFLTDFLAELYRSNRGALWLVMEEADEAAPQSPMPETRRLLDAVDKIARRGRFKGFRLIMITQRPAVLHKNVLTQLQTLVTHRLTAPQDRKAIEEWIKGHGDLDQAKAMMQTLARLERGEAWVWAPEQGILERSMMPKIKTFDSSRTPDPDEEAMDPTSLASVDLEDVRKALEPPEQPVQKPEKYSKVIPAIDHNAIEEAERQGYERGHQEGADSTLRAVASLASQLSDAIGRAEVACADAKRLLASFSGFTETMADEIASRPRPAIIPATTNGSGKSARPAPKARHLNSAGFKMLAVLDTNPPVRRSWTQVATLAGLKARGGHFNEGRKGLIDGGLVVEDGGLVRISAPSEDAASPQHDPAALVEIWARNLSGAAPKILRYIARHGPKSREAIAAGLDMQPRGGHWNAAWKELRDNDIVKMNGDRAALSELFKP